MAPERWLSATLRNRQARASRSARRRSAKWPVAMSSRDAGRGVPSRRCSLTAMEARATTLHREWRLTTSDRGHAAVRRNSAARRLSPAELADTTAAGRPRAGRRCGQPSRSESHLVEQGTARSVQARRPMKPGRAFHLTTVDTMCGTDHYPRFTSSTALVPGRSVPCARAVRAAARLFSTGSLAPNRRARCTGRVVPPQSPFEGGAATRASTEPDPERAIGGREQIGRTSPTH